MNIQNFVNTQEVDLTNCDREAIHIPGAIQPHGILLVLQEPFYK
jgi:two-component system, chemotaxis family, sensor kinase Cph1